MSTDANAALFLMLGQAAEKSVQRLEDIVPTDALYLSPSYDLAPLLPDAVRRSAEAAVAYRLFFVFEGYLRDLIVGVLSKDGDEIWWEKVPADVQGEVQKLELTEETKSWMALGSRDKSSLMTLPQLLKVIHGTWKGVFDEVVRDRD